MSRVLPHPLLWASLLLMWLLLNGFTVGHLVLGGIIAFGASWAMTALHPATARLRRWELLPRLIASVAVDVARSNVAVASIILMGRRRKRTTGFVLIPLDLRDPTALAVLSCILTCTPGTAWVEYRRVPARSSSISSTSSTSRNGSTGSRTGMRHPCWRSSNERGHPVLVDRLSQLFLVAAMACCILRMVRGPRAQDRVIGFDAFYVCAMLLLLTFGIRTGSTLYFEAALVISLLGFVSTVALAKFLMRGEVIE